MRHSEGFQGTTLQASRAGMRRTPTCSTSYSAAALRALSKPSSLRATTPQSSSYLQPASASAATLRYLYLWGRCPRSTSTLHGRLH
eukprot:scaffold23615_cov66-Phaeocystis_antarctica.AAC.2